jgi:Protein of unknown function (DUF4058)
MPIHDWTRVDAGLFHDFHQSWTVTLRNVLNEGVLPPDYFALAEQRVQGPIADVLTLKLSPDLTDQPSEEGGISVATVSPRTRLVRRSDRSVYADKADRITVRHRHGDVVAVIEIVSPGNKGGKADFQKFIKKSAELILKGIHLLVIDLFPPSPRDPQGIHKAIWDEFEEEELEPVPGKPLTLASYDAGPERVGYVEMVGVGDLLPDMPLFLRPEIYVPAPLDASYQTAWAHFPRAMKRLLEPPAAP